MEINKMKNIYITRAYHQAVNEKVNQMFESGELVAIEEEDQTILTTPDDVEHG